MEGVRPDWDKPQGEVDLSKLNNAERRRRYRTSLERKVRILEGHLNAGTPFEGGCGLPVNRTILRGWDEPGKRLWAWSDPKVDRPGGHNRDLIARYAEVIRVLEARATSTVPASPRRFDTVLRAQVATLKERLRERDSQMMAVLRQNAELLNVTLQLKARP